MSSRQSSPGAHAGQHEVRGHPPELFRSTGSRPCPCQPVVLKEPWGKSGRKQPGRDEQPFGRIGHICTVSCPTDWQGRKGAILQHLKQSRTEAAAEVQLKSTGPSKNANLSMPGKHKPLSSTSKAKPCRSK
eukprot:6487286-Amphidinium_carterae.1